MYRDKKYAINGFGSQEEMIDMFRWLREMGMTLESIGRLYGVTKVYVQKKTREIKPGKIVNRRSRKPQGG
jgi:hypothetical protein